MGSSARRRIGDTSLDCARETARLVTRLENLELLPDAVVLAKRESPPSSPVSPPSIVAVSSLADSSSSESSLSISRCVCSSFCCSSARLRTRRSELPGPAPPDRSTEPCRRACHCDGGAGPRLPSPLSEGVMARSRLRVRGEADGVPARLLAADWKTSLASDADDPRGVARSDGAFDDEA